VSAVERYDGRALRQQLREAHQATGFVGQNEFRHRLAGRWRGKADAVVRETRHHAIDGVGETRAYTFNLVGDDLQSFAKRNLHLAR
jgi:hypothetical protein